MFFGGTGPTANKQQWWAAAGWRGVGSPAQLLAWGGGIPEVVGDYSPLWGFPSYATPWGPVIQGSNPGLPLPRPTTSPFPAVSQLCSVLGFC